MDISTIWAAILAFFADARLYTLIGLIFLDLGLAITAAIKAKTFDLTRLAETYRTNVAPKLLAYLLLFVAFKLIPNVGDIVRESLTSISFGVVAAEQAGSIYGHLRAIGINPGDKE